MIAAGSPAGGTPARDRLGGVQVLRGVAALLVAMHHAQHEAGLLAGHAGLSFAPLTIVPWVAGIDIFFVISGLVMVHASGRLFARPGARRLFLGRRIARIVPLYWLASTAYLALALLAPGALNRPETSPGYVVASYLFIPVQRADGAVQPLYSLGWTLNYEMLFYALFALAVAWPRRRATALVCTMLAALVIAGLAFAPLPQPLAYWAEPIVLEFGLGMLLGLGRSGGLRLSPVWCAVLALGGIGLLVGSAVTPEIPALSRVVVYGLPATALVASAAFWRNGDRSFGPPARLASLVGDASYALYLTHPFAIRGLRSILEAGGLAGVVGPWPFILVSLLAAAAVAVTVHVAVERPLIRLARRTLSI